jgi:hypothetical protein
MMHSGANAELFQSAEAANPKDDLLPDALVNVTAIELVRNFPMFA